MPQGDIVKALKHGGIDIVRPADGNLFGFGTHGPGDKGVRHQHVPYGSVDLHALDDRAVGGGIVRDLGVRIMGPHQRRLQEGQQPEADLAETVLQSDRLDRSGESTGKMHPVRIQNPGCKRDAFGGVVIAADGKHLQAALHQPDQKTVKEDDRLGRWDRLIVEIPGEKHGIRALGVDDAQALFQNVGLVLHQAELVQALSQMEVGEMDELHGFCA